MNKKIAIIAVIVAIVIVGGGAYAALELNHHSSKGTPVTLSETGSTLLYPLFNEWAANYTSAKITTQGTGSGTGISDAIEGTVVIGASDAFMTNALLAAHPNMLNIPIAISAQYIAYNLPGLSGVHLTLSGPVIAGIYNNSIQYWDNNSIKALNPGLDLPHKRIVPVYRSDGSGDTNMFTLFLSRSDSWWNSTVGYGTSVNWPTNNASHGAPGNAGVVSLMQTTPYSIGYVAMTFTSSLESAGLGYAGLVNKAGNVVLPSVQNVSYAANQYLSQIPADGRIGIAFAPGATSYPIATFEYVIVQKTQPSQSVASALKTFLTWAVSANDGSANKYLAPLYLVPLPSSVVSQVTTPIIGQITAG